MILGAIRAEGPPPAELQPPPPDPSGDGSFAAELQPALQAAIGAALICPAPVVLPADWGTMPERPTPAPAPVEDRETLTADAAMLETAGGAAYLLRGSGLETTGAATARPPDAGVIEVEISFEPARLAENHPPLPEAPDDSPSAENLQMTPDGLIELSLAPDELGPLTMVLEPAGDHIAVHITVAREDTLALARGHAGELGRLLAAAGYRDARLSFSRAAPEVEARPARPAEAPDAPQTPRGLRRRGIDLKI